MHSPSVQAALAELDAKATAAAGTDAGDTLKHAVHILTQFAASIPRALRQLKQHAAFKGTGIKAETYRECARIITAHTQVDIPLVRRTDGELFELATCSN